jgi:hypothetical protein
MKFIRNFALIASISLFLIACGNDSDDTTVSSGESGKASGNALLAHIPADTAYVYANLEVVPKAITDVYVARFQPAIEVMNQHARDFQKEYEDGAFEGSPVAMFASMVLEELGNDLSTENLEKYGISLQSNHAVYATGVFPVMRIELTNATELRNAIKRIEAKMGMALPVSESNGTSYWRLVDEDQPLGLYITILDHQLAISAFPVTAEDSLLAAFLGQEFPADSMASGKTLAKLNSKKGYAAYGSGILDLQKVSDELLTAGSTTRGYLGPEVTAEIDSLDAVCIAEARAMITKAPRMTVGTTSFTANEMAMRYELEIENSLAAGLLSLVSEVPAAIEGDNLLSASLALNVGKLRNFILEKANNVVASPYQCSQLQELNQNAEKLVEQLNIPMPPMVNNLKGMRVRMDDFDPDMDFSKASGLVALHVDKPEMFVGMASMMVPGFDSLDLANQKDPVRVPADVLPIAGVEVFALMGEEAIGAAVGEQYSADLKGFMNVDTANNGTFFSLSYDMAKQMKIQQAITKDMVEYQDPTDKYTDALYQSYMEVLGRSRIDMSFTADGLIFDSTMTFK